MGLYLWVKREKARVNRCREMVANCNSCMKGWHWAKGGHRKTASSCHVNRIGHARGPIDGVAMLINLHLLIILLPSERCRLIVLKDTLVCRGLVVHSSIGVGWDLRCRHVLLCRCRSNIWRWVVNGLRSDGTGLNGGILCSDFLHNPRWSATGEVFESGQPWFLLVPIVDLFFDVGFKRRVQSFLTLQDFFSTTSALTAA